MPGRPKGHPKTGGRTKGVPNKSTAKAREAIAAFVDANSSRLEGWLDKIEQDEGPRAAFDSFTKLVEYHVPKLGRQEVTGPDGGAVQHALRVVWGD